MANSKYVVMCDAVVVTTGKKQNGRPEYTRVLRGGRINGNAESDQIRGLVRLGALSEATSKEEFDALRHKSRRLTVRDLARLAGAPDDPAQEPLDESKPLPAPVPETDPSAILASAE